MYASLRYTTLQKYNKTDETTKPKNFTHKWTTMTRAGLRLCGAVGHTGRHTNFFVGKPNKSFPPTLLSFPPFYLSFPLPLEVGPLNTANGSGGALYINLLTYLLT